MYRLLLIDHDTIHAERLAARLRQRGLVVTIVTSVEEAANRLQMRTLLYELVVIVGSGLPEGWLRILRRVKRACRPLYLLHRPLFLFVSNRKCNPHLRLRIERQGARYIQER